MDAISTKRDPVRGDRRRRVNRKGAAILGVGTVVLLAVGAGAAAFTGHQSVVHSMAVSGSSSRSLLGSWRVSEAAGAGRNVVVSFAQDADQNNVSLTQPCPSSPMVGTWRADTDENLLIEVDPDDSCTGRTPAWLTQVAGYRVQAADRLLVDRHGTQVARLTPAPATPGVSTPETPDPAEPALPAGTEPATVPFMTGTWTAENAATHDGVLHFDATRWVASGCNAVFGPWTIGPNGSLIVVEQDTVGPGNFCRRSEPGNTAETAVRAARQGAALILIAQDGTTTVFHHTGPDTVVPSIPPD